MLASRNQVCAERVRPAPWHSLPQPTLSQMRLSDDDTPKSTETNPELTRSRSQTNPQTPEKIKKPNQKPRENDRANSEREKTEERESLEQLKPLILPLALPASQHLPRPSPPHRLPIPIQHLILPRDQLLRLLPGRRRLLDKHLQGKRRAGGVGAVETVEEGVRCRGGGGGGGQGRSGEGRGVEGGGAVADLALGVELGPEARIGDGGVVATELDEVGVCLSEVGVALGGAG